ncbi:RHS repeat-associated core domain-containing protein [Embleya scabrispora]|uniref:RHS repeat-associated core domain-containing protein n=1 Tax=Embleya scabrispora TaxID=159449 RepID=UPI0003AA7AF6|nr:RHS repeat-associated core domain-containing protein [Embleya scabrispora]MYS81862.1 hypothetical protein [Streptomyces sp. SID5474]
MGHQTHSVDPDKGVTDTTYNAVGAITSVTDARGSTLTYAYDEIGRKTAVYAGAAAPANQLASWSYDRLLKGVPDGSVRYVGGANGAKYATETTSFDAGYRPTGTRVSIPAVEGALAGTYDASSVFEPIEGLPYSSTRPAIGDLSAETVYYAHNGGGGLVSVGGLADYVNWTEYDPFGRPRRITYGDVPKQVAFTRVYDDATGRVLRSLLDKQTATTTSVDATTYTYKPSGDVTSISTSREDGSVDRQCFNYDHMQRLTQAWTDTGIVTTRPGPSVPGVGGCSTTTPSGTNVGGPVPYWQDFEYDGTGNRTKLVEHDPTGAAGTVTTYQSPTAGQAKPHTVGSAGITGPAGSSTRSWTYDAAGNTISRPAPDAGTQALTWDAEGHLASDTTTGGGLAKTSSYTYDSEGNRLIRRDPGRTTLYLGSDEVTLTIADNKVTGTRSYATPDGGPVVVREAGKLSYQAVDEHGTGTTSLDAATLATARRALKPFGEPRGTAPAPGTWAGDKGFVGGTADSATGLTHLGAREYDPGTGRFLSVDPVMDLSRSQQMHGYLYAGGNPATNSDPTGLDYCPSSECNHYDPNVIATLRYETHDEAVATVENLRRQEDALGIPRKASTVKYRPRPAAEPPAPPAAPKPPKPKKCGRFDLACKASKAIDKVTDKVKSEVQEWKDEWKHKLVNPGVGMLAAVGTAACIAAAFCGVGLFVVGASYLYVMGLEAHMAVATPEERKAGPVPFMLGTAKAEAKGIIGGTLFGRGLIGGFVRGPQEKWVPRAAKWGGKPPILSGVPRGEWRSTVAGAIKSLWS